MKKLFDLNDTLVNSILIGSILVIVLNLILIFRISNGFIIKQNEVKEINEYCENMSESECFSLQLRCYRENIGSSEEEILEKCKEINFCL